MSLFKQIEGDSVVLTIGGVYKPADLYTRNGYLFAAHAGGYVRLYANGSTSKDKCGIDTLLFEKPLHVDKLGRLCDASVTGAKAIDAPKLKALTNG